VTLACGFGASTKAILAHCSAMSKEPRGRVYNAQVARGGLWVGRNLNRFLCRLRGFVTRGNRNLPTIAKPRLSRQLAAIGVAYLG
jgi:hypothetical protein